MNDVISPVVNYAVTGKDKYGILYNILTFDSSGNHSITGKVIGNMSVHLSTYTGDNFDINSLLLHCLGDLDTSAGNVNQRVNYRNTQVIAWAMFGGAYSSEFMNASMYLYVN